jgi:hypothetical protein
MWPDRRERRNDIIIQQDGASSHVGIVDEEFRRHCTEGGWNISLETQPAKSSDTNVLDLSFLRALQAVQWKSGYEKTIDGLIGQVRRAFSNLNQGKLILGF